MIVKGVTPILNVSSLEASFAWFETLGWTKAWDFGDPPDFGSVRNGTIEIFLCKDGQGGRGTAPGDDPWKNSSGTWITWWLESPAAVDALHARALELHVSVTWPPTDMPWNVRECHLRHPDGHTFRVSAGLPED